MSIVCTNSTVPGFITVTETILVEGRNPTIRIYDDIGANRLTNLQKQLGGLSDAITIFNNALNEVSPDSDDAKNLQNAIVQHQSAFDNISAQITQLSDLLNG